MYAEEGHLYHLFNHGNNQELLFGDDEDYLLFLKEAKANLRPACEILAWCLMPNHFHFCLLATENSVREVISGRMMIQALSKSVGTLLSNYAARNNAKLRRTGARFRPKTKLKDAVDSQNKYDVNVIRYVHYNPVGAGLVSAPEDWIYSSAREYAGLRNGNLCNLKLAAALGLLCP